MIVDARFLVGLLILLAALYAIGVRTVTPIPGGQSGLIAGLGFSFVSFAVGHHWIRWSLRRGGASFATAVMGGFLSRVLGLLALVVILMLVPAISAAVALITVVIAYFIVGAVEIVYLRRSKAIV